MLQSNGKTKNFAKCLLSHKGFVILSAAILLGFISTVKADDQFGTNRILYTTSGKEILMARCLLEGFVKLPAPRKHPSYFDLGMMKAVKSFQELKGLNPVGNIGPATSKALGEDRALFNRCALENGFDVREEEPVETKAKEEHLLRSSKPLRDGEAECRSNAYKTSEEVNADFNRVLKLQILMDRFHFSSGEFDGVCGSNTRKAVFDWLKHSKDQTVNPLDESSIDAALEANGGTAFRYHTLKIMDVAGPFLGAISANPADIAALSEMGFTSKLEKLGELFQTSIQALKRLNPQSVFEEGNEIMVPRLGKPPQKHDGHYWLELYAIREVLVLRTETKVLARWPVTINPNKTPFVPMEVYNLASNPTYPYEGYTFPSGPNNWVGTEWRGLRSVSPEYRHLKGYGIHGSPEPSRISKQTSAGCIRLTNWDAEELSKAISIGTILRPL